MKHIYSQEPEPEKFLRKPITRRRGRPAKEYFPIGHAMEYIAPYKFQTLTEYRDYVIEQKMSDHLPLDPNLGYGKQYPGVDAFFGNPIGTSKKRIRKTFMKPEVRTLALEMRRKNKAKRLKEEALKKIEVVAPVKAQTSSVSTKPSLSVCFEVLLKHNVSFSTLNKVNKEMQDISIIDAREITSVLLEFLTKEDKVIA